VVLAMSIALASAHYEGRPTRHEIALTCIIALAPFAMGAVSHFAIRAVLHPASETSWLDALITSVLIGLTGVAIARKVIGTDDHSAR
jgi:hypothetical protein